MIATHKMYGVEYTISLCIVANSKHANGRQRLDKISPICLNRRECAFLSEFFCIISVFLVSEIFNLYNKDVRVLAVNYVFCF